MQRILFALAAFVLTGTLVATAEDPTPIQLPAAQPKVVQPKVQPAQPWGIALSATRMMQLEEDFETAEAQRDVKKAYVKAAEVGVRVAEVNLDRLVKLLERAVISKEEVEKVKLEVEVAKAQVMIRLAELKESEVKVKFAKKRLDDAKGMSVRPAPGGVRPAPVDPTPNVLSTEKTIAELKIEIDTLIVEAEQRAEKVKRAGLILVVAEQSLEKLREVAKVGRLQAGTIERAEAVVAEAQSQVAKLSAERKALDAEIDALRKKLKEIGK